MTDPGEELLPQISSDLFEAIGEVTVYATALEWNLAYLAAIALGEDDEWLRTCLTRTGQARRAFRVIADQNEADNAAEATMRSQIAALRQAADAVLDDRHSLVHSIVVHSFTQGGPVPTLRWWNPRSDVEAEVTIEQVHEHVHELQLTRAKAIKIATPVLAWHEIRTADQLRTSDHV